MIQTLPSGPSASCFGLSGRSNTLSTTGAAEAVADARTVAVSAAVKSFGRWVVRIAAVLSRRVRGMHRIMRGGRTPVCRGFYPSRVASVT